MQDKIKIADLLLEKFVSEEIMTKSECQVSLDRMMDKHTSAIASKSQTKEESILMCLRTYLTGLCTEA